MLVIRREFVVGERTFMVLGESWFDGAGNAWKGRFVFMPLDGSLTRGSASTALVRAARRDAVVRRLGGATDRVIQRAFRAIADPAARGR